jgi:cellulose synthase/poly-beta-1,6-N-acetylglucosamine synthase-like glycosyltransferase
MDHLWRLACFVETLTGNTVYVQGLSDHRDAQNPFQKLLSPEVSLCYRLCLPSRERAGFLPFLGHAGAFRASAWQRIGGFPELVSEDYAFAVQLRRAGMDGALWSGAASQEAVPADFSRYCRRLCKFAAGTAEFMRWLARSRKSAGRLPDFTEALDLIMQLAIYPLHFLALVNLFVAGWLWAARPTMPLLVPPALPPVFAALVLLPAALLTAGSSRSAAILRFWGCASAIYIAAMPVAALAFLKALRGQAKFEPTGAGASAAQARKWRHEAAGTFALGAIALAAAWYWTSPFRWVVAGYGTAFAMFPLLTFAHRCSLSGRLVRCLLPLPVTCFMLGLVALWNHCWF